MIEQRLPLIELIAVALSAPLLMFPNRFSLLALVLLPAVGLLRLAIEGGGQARSRADWPLIGLILMTSVSLYPSIDLSLSRPKLYGLILGFAVFRLVVERLRVSWGTPIFTAFQIAGGVGVAIVGFVGTDWLTVKVPVLAPIYNRLPHLIHGVTTSSGATQSGFQPNEVAGTLALLFPLAIAIVLWESRRWLRVLAGLGALVMATTLALTFSRSGLLGTAIAMVFLLVLRWPRLIFAVPVVILATAIAIWRIGLDRVGTWLLALPTAADASGKAAGRLELWNRAFYMIQDFPFTGIGLNTFPVVVGVLYPLVVNDPDVPVPHAHDFLLQVAIDLGLPGLICFLLLLAAAAIGLVRAWKTRQGWERGLVAGIAAGLVGHLIFGLTDAVTLGAKPGVFLWSMLGAAVALGLPPATGAVRRSARAWIEWGLFIVACALGIFITVTNLVMFP
jgi:O-antigen ligase